MIPILIIAFVLIAALAFSIYRKPRALPDVKSQSYLPDREFKGLFDDHLAYGTPEQVPSVFDKRRAALLERAAQGDARSLDDALAMGGLTLYREVLDAAVESVRGCQEDFDALVSHIVESEQLRASTRLASSVIEAWRLAPDKRSTILMLHVAALSDDAAVYQLAVESALTLWRQGQLDYFQAPALLELIEREYWLLAPEARRSGEGQVLKHLLSGVRRQLAAATTRRET